MCAKYVVLLISLCFLSAIGCSDKDTLPEEMTPSGKWADLSDGFPAYPRSNAVAFSDQNSSYIGLGSCENMIGGHCPNFSSPEPFEYAEIWNHSQSNSWNQLQTFPGEARQGAVAFVINDKAYVGLGTRTMRAYVEGKIYSDFWVYDLKNHQWEDTPLKFIFPGEARGNAVAFSINGKGYVGTGMDKYNLPLKDFYEFDPQTGWTKITFPGDKRMAATAFVIEKYAYVGLGLNIKNGKQEAITDFWKFNPEDKSWEPISPKPTPESKALARHDATSFVLYKDGLPYAYVLGGMKERELLSSCWGYNPRSNTWAEVTPLPFSGRSLGFSVNGQQKTGKAIVLEQEIRMQGYVFSIEE